MVALASRVVASASLMSTRMTIMSAFRACVLAQLRAYTTVEYPNCSEISSTCRSHNTKGSVVTTRLVMRYTDPLLAVDDFETRAALLVIDDAGKCLASYGLMFVMSALSEAELKISGKLNSVCDALVGGRAYPVLSDVRVKPSAHAVHSAEKPRPAELALTLAY